MKPLPQILTALAILFLSGCLFEHPVSEKPTRKLDKLLLGVWDGSNDSKLTISKADDYHYKIQIESAPREVETMINLIGHHAMVGDKDVVWLRWIPPEQNNRRRVPIWLPCTYDLGKEHQLRIAIPNEEKLPLISQAVLSIRKGTADALNDYYKVAIPRDDFFHPIPTRFTRREEQAEQGGAGQPATRPESKSEGSNKPQPESEGRSR